MKVNQNQFVVNKNALNLMSLLQNIEPHINNEIELAIKSLIANFFKLDPANFGYISK